MYEYPAPSAGVGFNASSEAAVTFMDRLDELATALKYVKKLTSGVLNMQPSFYQCTLVICEEHYSESSKFVSCAS